MSSAAQARRDRRCSAATSTTKTNYGDMTKTVRERIEDLNRRAYALASRIAGSAMDSGCTDIRPTGPRQSKAWDMIAEAYGWNAISDNAEALKAAEELERDGTSYRIEYGSAGFQVVLVEEPKPEETIVKRRPEAPADDRCSTCHRDAHRPGMGGLRRPRPPLHATEGHAAGGRA